jgi:hypothetical protein
MQVPGRQRQMPIGEALAESIRVMGESMLPDFSPLGG